MKKLIQLLGILALAMSFQGCSNDKDPFGDGNHRFGQDEPTKFYTFHLSLGGDYVDQSEEPLVRATDTPSTYVGINVTRKDKSDQDAKSENYAYGVYTTRDNISIDLMGGYTYDFEATILRDGTDKYINISGQFKEPFNLGEPDTNWLRLSDLNKFFYNRDLNNLQWLNKISDGEVRVQISDQPTYVSEFSNCAYPRVDRYYGTRSDIDPENLASNDRKIVIKLDYKCFGLKIVANTLPYNTTLKVRDINNPNDTYRGGNCLPFLLFPKDLEFNNDFSEWEDVYSVNDLKNDSKIKFNLEFSWDRGLGMIETIPCEIEVEPRTKKILQVKISGSASSQLTGNIILETTDDASSLTPNTQDVSHSGRTD